MSIIGKLHEISLYGLIANIICLICGKVTLITLWEAAFHPNSFVGVFQCYLFWASVLFIPIAIIGAVATKYRDYGEGLTFFSSNIVIIIFAHIGEELLGLVSTPYWFVRDVFIKNLDEPVRIVDYILYLIEIIFIIIGMIFIFNT